MKTVINHNFLKNRIYLMLHPLPVAVGLVGIASKGTFAIAAALPPPHPLPLPLPAPTLPFILF
jgi:hypothetical protein